MPKGEGYGNFEETFGSQNEQPYDSSSVMNKADCAKAAKANASYLRSTGLGNAASGGRPFGKQVDMPRHYGKKAMGKKTASRKPPKRKPAMKKPAMRAKRRY